MSDAYNPASRPCAKGPMPGCTLLQRSILEFWPAATNVGTFICRPTADGAPSVHGNGRAGDIGGTSTLVQAVADWLVANHSTLGVQLVIANHRIWNVMYEASGWRPYGCDKAGSPKDHHTSHVHWEINVDAGQHLTRSIIDGVRPDHPGPPPIHVEDDMQLIYFSDEDSEGLEIASDNGNMTGIPDERTRDSLLRAGFQKVAVSAAYFELLKSKTTL